jgi:hypothetical protein
MKKTYEDASWSISKVVVVVEGIRGAEGQTSVRL